MNWGTSGLYLSGLCLASTQLGKVLYDYQESFKALQDLSKKIKEYLPLTDRVALSLKVNFDLQRCLEAEQISLSQKIQAISTNFELTRTLSKDFHVSSSITKK